MTPSTVSIRVVVSRLAVLDEMVAKMRALPLADREEFFQDERNIWACESYLRRSLEAILDIGRHILAKAFGVAPGTYKALPLELGRLTVLTTSEAELLEKMAGYRNRLVHLYHEISAIELFDICSQNLADLELIGAAYRRWLLAHPEKADRPLGTE